MTASRLVAACRVPPAVPAGTAGLWELRRMRLPDDCPELAAFVHVSSGGLRMGDEYVVLLRTTAATLHEDRGEVVMDDTPRELRRHLPILLAARGRILITGLGLGCVLRGLLSKPEVEHVDVVEIDPAVVKLAGAEFQADPRVSLHVGDALTVPWPRGARWDFAWHDVWTEEDGKLDILHSLLLARYRHSVARQGAWQLDRPVKRAWPDQLVNARRRRANVGAS